MKLIMKQAYDVLVIGSGIAGLSAAVEASKQGCKTAIVSSTHLFSGSSFYPGTWGFGLVGPSDENDIEDMIDTIHRVGCGIADPSMVRTFVTNINSAIEHLEDMGCHPKKANQSTEREYIPCFDHKHRNWNGLEVDGLHKAFTEQLSKYHVTILDDCALLDLVKDKNRICGAVFAHDDQIEYIGCKSLVLATGGYGSLFRNHLCTNDVCGLGQYLALKAGCQLINMEFMQMMPGYLYPARNTIFNEKTFRFATFRSSDNTPVFSSEEETLLDLRSTYGPFTCRLPSYKIDQKLYQASLESDSGVEVSYAEAAKNDPPEFIKIYFDWLATEKRVHVNDTIHIGIFAHAANGGIRINENGWTGVDGLFACGEVTGGMHGADRIGGLSTANGLVFGQRTGVTAASAAMDTKEAHCPESYDFTGWMISDRLDIREKLKKLMYENAMIIRNETGMQRTLDELKQTLGSAKHLESSDVSAIKDSRILEGQLMTAICVLEAALLRKESRGSHFREDYPQMNDAMTCPIEITLQDKIVARFNH